MVHNRKGTPPAKGVPLVLVSCSPADTSINTTTTRQVQAGNRARRQRLVEHLHRLGPAPLAHFIREIEKGADIDATLVAYGQLDPNFVRSLGGSEFPPTLHLIDDGQP